MRQSARSSSRFCSALPSHKASPRAFIPTWRRTRATITQPRKTARPSTHGLGEGPAEGFVVGHRQLPLSDKRGRALHSPQAFRHGRTQESRVTPPSPPQVAQSDSQPTLGHDSRSSSNAGASASSAETLPSTQGATLLPPVAASVASNVGAAGGGPGDDIARLGDLRRRRWRGYDEKAVMVVGIMEFRDDKVVRERIHFGDPGSRRLGAPNGSSGSTFGSRTRR